MNTKTLSSVKLLTVLAFWSIAVANAPPAKADAPQFEVVVQEGLERAHLATRTIPELEGKDRFETEILKVVLGRSNIAIPIAQANPEIKLKAATVFYQTLQARNYFLNTLNLDEVTRLPQVTARIEIDEAYYWQGPYQNANTARVYNNARSIPPGKPLQVRPCAPDATPETWDHPNHYCNETPWGYETWYSPVKPIPTSTLLLAMKEDPMEPTVRDLRQVFYPMEGQFAIQDFVSWANRPGRTFGSLETSALTLGKSIFIVEGAFLVMKQLNRGLLPSHFLIDSALVPDIIHHEFTHLAFSHLMTGHEVSIDTLSPLNEGIADFFAAKMNNKPAVGAKNPYLKGAAHSGKKSDTPYKIEYENYGRDTIDYVLSVLWHLKDAIGPEQTARVVKEACYHIDTKKQDLYSGLPYAILLACAGDPKLPGHEKPACDVPTRDTQRLLDYFARRM